MKQRDHSKQPVINPPQELIRIKVDTSWAYGKRAKFWEIEVFNQELSNRYGQVYYSSVSGGLAYTKIGMMFAARRKIKKMKIGNYTTHYAPNGEVIDVEYKWHIKKKP